MKRAPASHGKRDADSAPPLLSRRVGDNFRRMRSPLALCLLLAAACGAGDKLLVAPCTVDCTPVIPTAMTVAFAGGTVNAEIAATSTARSTGLSNRPSIAADSGMIFVFGQDQIFLFKPFWMHNTHFDLSIAFIDAQKMVINIEEMTKDTDVNHFATASYRYAVEAPKGWFAAHGVVAGAAATFTVPAGVIIDP